MTTNQYKYFYLISLRYLYFPRLCRFPWETFLSFLHSYCLGFKFNLVGLKKPWTNCESPLVFLSGISLRFLGRRALGDPRSDRIFFSIGELFPDCRISFGLAENFERGKGGVLRASAATAATSITAKLTLFSSPSLFFQVSLHLIIFDIICLFSAIIPFTTPKNRKHDNYFLNVKLYRMSYHSCYRAPSTPCEQSEDID